jgi:hypothetical protein
MLNQPVKSFAHSLVHIAIAALLALAALPGRVTAQQNSAPTLAPTATAVPTIIQFNGQLTEGASDSLRAARPATVSITFTLYEAQWGGAPLWAETQNVQVDTQGRYTALLGSTYPEGLPLGLFTSGQARWLAAQPLFTGFAEEPRVMLVGVPYAMRAADADTLGGLPASAFVTVPAAGTSASSEGLTGSASSSADSSGGHGTPGAHPPVTGSGITGYIPMWTSSTALGDSILEQTSSNAVSIVAGNFNLPQSTSAGVGALTMNGTPFLDACCSANSGNTFVGLNAGNFITPGSYNTAIGSTALHSNTTGSENTASGHEALYSNTTGSNNTASGDEALYSNTTGGNNTASGGGALATNSTGSNNAAFGFEALVFNTTGTNNTASGGEALYSNTTGSDNIAIGYEAANKVAPANSNNIEIGNVGSSPDSGAIRIGTVGTQTSSYIAGIYGVTLPTAGQPLVCVDSAGQLGTLNCATSRAPSAQQEAINLMQQEQIEALQKQNETLQKRNEDFEQRLARLEALTAKN